MIYYPLETLCKAGINDIMIVTGGNSAGDFLRLLGNGRDFGLKDIYYTYQEGEGGIADALKLCEHFAEMNQSVCVILGDNIIQDDIYAVRGALSPADLGRAACCSKKSTIPSASASRRSTATASCASSKSRSYR